jgi:predicted Zn-dependent peptidase
MPLNMLSLLLVTVLLPQAPTWQTHSLSNGATLHVLTSKDAPKQATMTFLPLGLTSDRRDEAQFAHLGEHMMIRSTDPKLLKVGSISLNGETTNEVLRLESLADPEDWAPALERHIKWLHNRTVDAKVLAREKVRIEGEERGTVPRGLNHKWAAVAWTQYMAGSDHAAVHGDVAAATIEGVRAYLQRIPIRGAIIFAIGPRTAAEQVERLETTIKAVTADDEKDTAGAADADKKEPEPAPHKPGHRQLTWDFDASHYLEWYPLPKDCSRVEAQVIAQLLFSLCYRDSVLRAVPGYTAISAVHHGDRNHLLFSANLQEDTKEAQLQKSIAKVLKQSKPALRFQLNGKLLLKQILDFEMLQKQATTPKFRELIGMQHALNVGTACMRSRLSLKAMKTVYEALDAKRLIEFVDQALAQEHRSSCTISKR